MTHSATGVQIGVRFSGHVTALPAGSASNVTDGVTQHLGYI
jgi:hypothetical protein